MQPAFASLRHVWCRHKILLPVPGQWCIVFVRSVLLCATEIRINAVKGDNKPMGVWAPMLSYWLFNNDEHRNWDLTPNHWNKQWICRVSWDMLGIGPRSHRWRSRFAEVGSVWKMSHGNQFMTRQQNLIQRAGLCWTIHRWLLSSLSQFPQFLVRAR